MGAIENQQEFVRWWNENVSVRYATNQHVVVNSDTELTKDRAESATGISQVQVSRWRKSLRDPQKYRGMLRVLTTTCCSAWPVLAGVRRGITASR
jgi:hypothetical protein